MNVGVDGSFFQDVHSCRATAFTCDVVSHSLVGSCFPARPQLKPAHDRVCETTVSKNRRAAPFPPGLLAPLTARSTVGAAEDRDGARSLNSSRPVNLELFEVEELRKKIYISIYIERESFTEKELCAIHFLSRVKM